MALAQGGWRSGLSFPLLQHDLKERENMNNPAGLTTTLGKDTISVSGTYLLMIIEKIDLFYGYALKEVRLFTNL